MTLGELFNEAVSTGWITSGEMAWVISNDQYQYTRAEEAVARRLSRLIDKGVIELIQLD